MQPPPALTSRFSMLMEAKLSDPVHNFTQVFTGSWYLDSKYNQ